MKIYTKSGDDGKTSLIGGKRVAKSHLRIDAYGTVDEINAYTGLLADQDMLAQRRSLLQTIQGNLFVIGAMLASDPGYSSGNIPQLEENTLSQLEEAIDEMEKKLPPLKNFILPGGHPVISYCHIARNVCRRAERSVIRLGEEEQIEDTIIKYLNRLSDYFFVLGRTIAHENSLEEIPWKGK